MASATRVTVGSTATLIAAEKQTVFLSNLAGVFLGGLDVLISTGFNAGDFPIQPITLGRGDDLYGIVNPNQFPSGIEVQVLVLA